jgi:hypothetical protein
MEGTQSFEPYDFLDRLKRDEIYPPIVLYGMVKPSDDDDECVLFAQGDACENWLRIRLSSIENIRVLSLVSCDDHKHPRVALVLKQPETDEGRLFSSLLTATSGQVRNLRSIPRERHDSRVAVAGRRHSAEDRAIPHGPDAGNLLPSCSGCPAWVDDNGWFGILVGCSANYCNYAGY